MSGFTWDQSRVARMKALWLDGRTATEIHEILRAPSRNAVVGKLHRLGLFRNATPEARKLTGKVAQRALKSPPAPKVKAVKAPPAPVIRLAPTPPAAPVLRSPPPRHARLGRPW